MKSKEEVEAILNDPGNDKREKMFETLVKMDFTAEQLALILVGVVDEVFPKSDIEAFSLFIKTVGDGLGLIEAELAQVEEPEPEPFDLNNREHVKAAIKEARKLQGRAAYMSPGWWEIEREVEVLKDRYFSIN